MNNHKDSIILGIESSCDDTSAAILINGVIYSNITANQAFIKNMVELFLNLHQEPIKKILFLLFLLL